MECCEAMMIEGTKGCRAGVEFASLASGVN